MTLSPYDLRTNQPNQWLFDGGITVYGRSPYDFPNWAVNQPSLSWAKTGVILYLAEETG
jgi:hypothetical protein